MTDGLVIHIAAGLDKHTEVLMQERIRIGAGTDCNLRLNPSLLPSSESAGLVLELGRTNGYYRVTDFDPNLEITHNGARLVNYSKIDDGDEVRIGPNNLLLTFFPVGGILYIGFSLYREVQTSRRVIDAQNDQLAKMREELGTTRREVSKVDESNKIIRDSLSLAPKLRADYGNGVCLVSGSYIFVERGTNRPLRYPEVQTNEDGVVIQNGADPLQLTPDGNGTIAEFEFVGTGFHVGEGFILTNRHVAQPWLADERAASLTSSASGQPRLKKLMAFFPQTPLPFTLKYKQSAQKDDLAVCLIENRDLITSIPVLPLDHDFGAVTVGQAVVMMGYPSGPDRLLALLDDAEARSIQARYGSSLESLLGYLAEKNHIQPLTTQGHITDLDARRVVYDARTAEGGSGAPLFGQSGRVIGINFAVFTENTTSNFAVPVPYGITLLQRARWKMPEGLDGDNENANTNATAASSSSSSSRSSTATSNASR